MIVPKRLAEIVAARIAAQQARRPPIPATVALTFACPRCHAARTYDVTPALARRMRRAPHDCPCGGPLLRRPISANARNRRARRP